MKKTYLLAAALLMILSQALTSCVKEDNPADPTEQPAGPTTPTDPSDQPTGDNVEAWLKAVPGVTNVTLKTGTNAAGMTGDFYYFDFDQLIDHSNPARGTFRQRAVLYYKGRDAMTVLHTQGYNTEEKLEMLVEPSLASIYKTNLLELEYRYFGTSQPEPLTSIDFSYLSHEQASADLHAFVTAMKQTGRFTGKWISSGVSKNGVTTAMYAYYSEKNGWSDIDVYVPFVAPFCLSLTDMRPATYLMEKSAGIDPEAQKKLKSLGRAIVSDTPLSDRLIATYKQKESGWVETLEKDKGFTKEKVNQYIAAYSLANYLYNLQSKMMYVAISEWSDIIPDPTGQSQLDFAEKFIAMNGDSLTAYLSSIGRARHRAMTDEETLKERQTYPLFSYDVQVGLEIGSNDFDFSFAEDCPRLSKDMMKYVLEEQFYSSARTPKFSARYSNALYTDFLDNFLPATQKKMVFVYGEQDPWTGAAIPDPTNPNVRKFVVEKGCHNDFINYVKYCPVATYEKIKGAIDAFLKAE